MTKPVLNIAGLTDGSAADGPGMRLVLWMQGCHHHCPECHNPQTHDERDGLRITLDEAYQLLKRNSYVSGITLSGGEPMLQAPELSAMLELSQKIIRERNWNVWCYTGFTFEEILKDKNKACLLPYIDILVDGRFIKEETPGGKWKGSRNQRIIDVKRSLKESKTVLFLE